MWPMGDHDPLRTVRTRDCSGQRLLAGTIMPTSGQQGLEYPITNGYFYTQANGKAGEGGTGFSVTNNDNIPFYSEYRRMGGSSALGYPISRRFMWDGFVFQAFQKVVFQWRPEQDAVLFVNVFDKLSDTGQNDWLRTVRSVPNPIKLEETNKSFDQIKAGRLALLDANAAIKNYYLDVQGDPVTLNGLPTSSVEDFGNVYVLRAQRVVFQQWKIDVPWAKAGTVQVANGGDVGKEANQYPDLAIAPEPAGGQSGTPVAARGARRNRCSGCACRASGSRSIRRRTPVPAVQNPAATANDGPGSRRGRIALPTATGPQLEAAAGVPSGETGRRLDRHQNPPAHCL